MIPMRNFNFKPIAKSLFRQPRWWYFGAAVTLVIVVAAFGFVVRQPFAKNDAWGGDNGWKNGITLRDIENKSGNLQIAKGKKDGYITIRYQGSKPPILITWAATLPSRTAVYVRAKRASKPEQIDTAKWSEISKVAPLNLDSSPGDTYWLFELDLRTADIPNSPVLRAAHLEFVSLRQPATRTITWTGKGQSKNWTDAENWSPPIVPTENDVAAFTADSATDSVVDPAFAGKIAMLRTDKGFAHTITIHRSLEITHDVMVIDGTLDLDRQTVTVDGNWRVVTGKIVPGTSDVNLAGDTGSAVFGSNSFYDLSITVPGKQVFFEAGQTQTVSHDLIVAGSTQKPVLLQTPANTWKLSVGGSINLKNVKVKNCVNAGERSLKADKAVDGGGNIGWEFK